MPRVARIMIPGLPHHGKQAASVHEMGDCPWFLHHRKQASVQTIGDCPCFLWFLHEFAEKVFDWVAKQGLTTAP